ncbi:MAG: low temperature requirement protein A [Acidimicrobiales bacterium]
MDAGLTVAEERTTPLELFFDLVFVFAITQVTSLLAADSTWGGLLRAVLVLAALWWAWSAYSWLTNTIDPNQTGNRVAMLVAMAAMLVVALATPRVFGDDGVLFGAAYLIVRVMHIVLYARRSPDIGIRVAILRLAPTAFTASALLVGAGLLEAPVREAVWALALAVDYAGPFLFGVRGLRVSASHFAERFGLIVIIALGESIVAIGIGAAGLDLGPRLVGAAVLAMVVTAALWWAYFDVLSTLIEQALRRAHGDEQPMLARDAFSYLHLPMVTGIVMLAAGVKTTLAHADEPLASVPAATLGAGAALYLLAQAAVKLRTHGPLSVARLVAAAACGAVIPLATAVDADVALAAVAAIAVLVVVYEGTRSRERRAEIRGTAAIRGG